jgi:hypothetical protein
MRAPENGEHDEAVKTDGRTEDGRRRTDGRTDKARKIQRARDRRNEGQTLERKRTGGSKASWQKRLTVLVIAKGEV